MGAFASSSLLAQAIAAALHRPSTTQDADRYLGQILAREAVASGLLSAASLAAARLTPIVSSWGRNHLSYVAISGSFAKGTANQTGCDLDLLISLKSSCSVAMSDISSSLKSEIIRNGLPATMKNSSVGTKVGPLNVDLVPARQLSAWTNDHTIRNKRTGTWKKTNVQKHVQVVGLSGRLNEIRLLKLWRDQAGLDVPSFYLELIAIRALKDEWYGSLSSRFLKILDFIANHGMTARIEDPANSANVLSDELTVAEKAKLRSVAQRSLMRPWTEIVR